MLAVAEYNLLMRQTPYSKNDLLLKRVFFHSGCSIPFFAEIKFREEIQLLEFDPFSGYVLKQEE